MRPRCMLGAACALALLVVRGVPTDALAQQPVGSYTILGASVEEVARRLPFVVEAGLFGDPAMLGSFGHSVAARPFVGLFSDEGVLSGITVGYRTNRALPFGIGVHGGMMEADFTTWYAGISGHGEMFISEDSTLLVQAALAYQRLHDSTGDPTAIYFDTSDDPLIPRRDVVLLERFDATHLVVHTAYRFDTWALRPILDFAFSITRYDIEGRSCEPDCFELGDSRSKDGFVMGVGVGVGASVDNERYIVSGGLDFKRDAVALVTAWGARF